METAPQQPVSNPHHVYGKRRISPAFLITLSIIVVVAIALILFFMLKGHSVSVEKLNVTYSFALENGTIIGAGTNAFISGKVATGIGFATGAFDTEIASMKAGETKAITLEAKDAFGAYDSTLAFKYNRTDKMKRDSEINRTQNVTLDEFTQAFSEQPIVGKEYNISGAPWAYKVLSNSNDVIVLAQQATVGLKIPYGVFEYEVTKVTDSMITLRLQGNDSIIPSANGNIEIKFTNDEIAMTLTPEVGQKATLGSAPEARVVKLDADYIYLDANPEFAGEKITVTIKVNSITKEKSTAATGASVIAGAPTMQVFIMSHCPYGTQVVKGLIPVMDKFKGKANVELRFVSYTMHGAQEELDNQRIACVREEQNSKLTTFLECFVSGSGSEADTQKCIANIDKAKLDSCVASKAAGYLEEDNALNTEYGVQGSPTVIINGKEVSVGRDSQSLATALCDAFGGSEPSVCSESFSSTSPGAGFGSGSSSGSSGSCS